MARRARVGDVVELPTPSGLAYAQCTHTLREWGALLAVLWGRHATRPVELGTVVTTPIQFQTFFPLTQAINRKIFHVVANVPVPSDRQVLPTFRAAGFIDRTGRVHDWWLWNGEFTRQVRTLTDDQRRLPILGVINDTLLLEYLDQGWTPATDRRSQ